MENPIYLKAGENENYPDHVEGWYYWDETGDMSGRYNSREAAKAALDKYCHWLNTGETLK